nr:MAG TPA: hypothetical protein [Caudoviricetes sp.]
MIFDFLKNSDFQKITGKSQKKMSPLKFLREKNIPPQAPQAWSLRWLSGECSISIWSGMIFLVFMRFSFRSLAI